MKTGNRRFAMAALFCAACAAASGLTGCVSLTRTYEGNEVREEVVKRIEIGKTTRSEVLGMLGSPLRVERANITGLVEQALARYEGEKLTLQIDPALFNEVYIYERKQTNSLLVMGMFYNYYRSDQRSDRLAVFFDKEGVVLGVGWTPGRKHL
ncbi:MAG: hypothetical protein R6V03_08880 [Kiritimatiellia bacterium]